MIYKDQSKNNKIQLYSLIKNSINNIINMRKGLEGWEKLGPYREYVGLEQECVKTEILNKIMKRTFMEYDVYSYGIKYKKGNKTEKIEIKREKIFRRQYTNQTIHDLSDFIPRVFD